MRLNARMSVSVTAFILFGAAGASSVFAQSQQPASDTPSLSREVPVATEDASVPQLRPVEPVVTVPGAVPTEALVVPPSPRIVTGGPGSISIRGGGIASTSPYAMRPAAATSLRINSNFGWRGGRRHTGVDFQASYGDSVGASMSGVVAFAGVKHGYGNVIVLDHGNGVSTYYAHLSAMWVGVGQAVEPGQVIGAIGTTGRSTGPHLHYEVRINGEPVNPASLISFANGQVFVNGNAFTKDEDDEPVPGGEVKPITDGASTGAAGTRPRRVTTAKAGDGTAAHVIAADNSMTQY